ncbi:unnamed protein product [Acanthoscelides obtectus]|uniref:Uncharacterized protein n=1 Tax=Acanthoscelides obtectus TaxID=200917 RepID=A0A9P0QIP7_ACAOB|nr:unnamed protein product [Acanthoscelides obtectus]CAK1684480.1 hypothetical protein AOBTE_LOCUS34874 [Acanthoscelides obtectus]
MVNMFLLYLSNVFKICIGKYTFTSQENLCRPRETLVRTVRHCSALKKCHVS